jgi:hypothetical protein
MLIAKLLTWPCNPRASQGVERQNYRRGRLVVPYVTWCLDMPLGIPMSPANTPKNFMLCHYILSNIVIMSFNITPSRALARVYPSFIHGFKPLTLPYSLFAVLLCLDMPLGFPMSRARTKIVTNWRYGQKYLHTCKCIFHGSHRKQ